MGNQAELFGWEVFAHLTKVDEEKRLVYGRLAQEWPDKAGEIFDYEKSKPFFKGWIKETLQLSKGKACGNLRAMHSDVVAGIFVDIEFNDEEKAIDTIAKVIDNNEWQKVLEGAYTGFSIGGSYDQKWPDGKYIRYAGIPIEGSLVDKPCIPTATFFSVVKKDGTTELRKIAPREDVNPERGVTEYGDVKFADERNKKYPIDTEAHIRAAWNYVNKPKNAAMYSDKDLKTIKNKIIAAWKAKIDKEGPPSEQEKAQAISTLKKCMVADFIPQHEDVANMGEINDLFSAISCLETIYRLFVREHSSEDHPEAAEQVKALKIIIESLKTFIASEVTEINVSGKETEAAAEKVALSDKDYTRIAIKYAELLNKKDISQQEPMKEDKTMQENLNKKKSYEDVKAEYEKACKALEEEDDAEKRKGLKANRAELKKEMDEIEAEEKKKSLGIGDLSKADNPHLVKIAETLEQLNKRLQALESAPAPAKGKVIPFEKYQEGTGGGTITSDDTDTTPEKAKTDKAWEKVWKSAKQL